MITHLSNTLKSLLLGMALTASALAFALPSPKDIEAAVSQGHLQQAETLLREVIEAKPQSAKAHYELGQVLLREHRAKEAHAELLAAKAIDPSLKFATSAAQFEAFLSQANAQPAQSKTVANTAVINPTNAAPETSGFSLSHVWIGIAALVVIGLLIRRRPAPYVPAPSMDAGPGTAFGRNPGYAQPGYPSSYPPAASNGSTMTGAVVGGLAGVAAGYALSKVLEGDHRAAPVANSNSWADNQGLVSVDEPAVPAFDPGSGGNDWGGEGDAGSDDNW